MRTLCEIKECTTFESSAGPGRSGPKRLDNGHCDVALSTPSRTSASTAVPHPRPGRCLSTLVSDLRELCRQIVLDAQVRSRPPCSSTTCAQRRCRDCASAIRPPPSRAAKSSELRNDSTLAMRRANWLHVSPEFRRGQRWSRPWRMWPMTVSCRYTSPKRPASQLQSASPSPSQLWSPELRSPSSKGEAGRCLLRTKN